MHRPDHQRLIGLRLQHLLPELLPGPELRRNHQSLVPELALGLAREPWQVLLRHWGRRCSIHHCAAQEQVLGRGLILPHQRLVQPELASVPHRLGPA